MKLINDTNYKVNEKIRLIAVVTSLQIIATPFMTMLVNERGVLLYTALLYGITLFISLFFRKVKIVFSKIYFLLLILYIWETISLIWAINYDISITHFNQYVKLMLLVLLMANVEFNQKEIKMLMIAQTGIAVYISLFMLNKNETLYESGRLILVLDGVFQDPNYTCSLFILPILFCLKNIIKNNSLIKTIISLCILVLFIYIIIATGSRGGLFAVIVAALMLLKSEGRLSYRLILMSLSSVFFISLSFILFEEKLPQGMIERIATGFTLQDEGSGRFEIWKEILYDPYQTVFRSFFGYGKGATVYVYGLSAHNLVLESYVEIGLIGVSIVLMYLGFLYKKIKELNDGLLLSFYVGTLLMGLTLSVNSDKYFWMNLIIINLLINRERKISSESIRKKIS